MTKKIKSNKTLNSKNRQLKNQKQSIIKSIWNHKNHDGDSSLLEKISCNEATSSDDANGSNTIYGIFSIFHKTTDGVAYVLGWSR